MPKTVYAIEFVKPNGVLPMRTLAVSDSAVAFGAFDPSTTAILFTIEGADIRTRWDGTSPTALVGHLFEDKALLLWSVAQAEAAEFIREAGADASLYYSEMLLGA